jgi:type I restriction enzyme S subunit
MRLGDLVLPTQQRDPRQKPGEEFCYVDIAGIDNETKTIGVAKRIVSAYAPSRARKVIHMGDVIVSTVRPNLNAVALVPDNLDKQICSTGFSVLRPSSKVTSGYLFAFVRSPFFIDCLIARTTGANYPAVNDGEVKDVPISVPPLVEQERIVKLLNEADELRKLRAQADRCTAGLIPALFDEKFGDPTHLAKMCWSTKPLGEFAKVSYGLADKLDATTKPENGTRILTISNVLLHGSIDTKVEKYSVVEPAERAKARLQNFDLLFNWRNGSKEHVGKTAIWEGQVEGEVLHVSFLLKIRADLDQANPYFLWALINRLRATGYFTRNARMQINRKFNASELSALKLPLPPLVQQREFAARVSEIRAMQAEQTASHRRLDDLVQSMLHRAFKGEL